MSMAFGFYAVVRCAQMPDDGIPAATRVSSTTEFCVDDLDKKMRDDDDAVTHTSTKVYSSGSEGLWTFVFIDMVIFSLIFLVFMSERIGNFSAYEAAQAHLNELFGLANTLVLLTSSWMVVEAINRARQRNVAQVRRYLALAFVFGLVFVVNKVIEYHDKISHGHTPASEPFFSFYFFITGVHFLHVLAGMLCIVYFWRCGAECRTDPNFRLRLENVGLFWHYVDVLWIFIFPMLYLI